MKKFILIFAILTSVFTSCEEKHDGPSKNVASKYSGDVASKWIALQTKLIKKTAGFDPLVTARSFAYSGLTMYEAVVKGMPGYNSVASPLIGDNINALPDHQIIDWSASVNAAMAFILKNLFANTSAANMATIDSLESALNSESGLSE